MNAILILAWMKRRATIQKGPFTVSVQVGSKGMAGRVPLDVRTSMNARQGLQDVLLSQIVSTKKAVMYASVSWGMNLLENFVLVSISKYQINISTPPLPPLPLKHLPLRNVSELWCL